MTTDADGPPAFKVDLGAEVERRRLLAAAAGQAQ